VHGTGQMILLRIPNRVLGNALKQNFANLVSNSSERWTSSLE
jgi:hypothetical protein